ncbi:MAG: amidohydrolase family protein [Acidimicrobiia bacterium]
MNTDDLILVSVDDHLIEPPDLFEGALPSRFQDRAPRMVGKDDGTYVWRFENEEIANIAINAVAGRPGTEWGTEPTSLDELRPGTYDIHERVKEMNANGVLGSANFPSFPGFCGQLFSRVADKELGLATLQAYNDWHIERWAGAYPGRFIPVAITALWDPALAAAEVRRVAKKGCRAITFSENPHHLGYPSIHTTAWDPLWAACAEEGVVVCMHIGSSSQLVVTSPESPIDVLYTLTPLNLVQAAADLVWSHIFERFPTLTVALSEGGIGWIPYFNERIDYVFKQQHAWTGQDFGGRMPSEIFNERVVTCFISDEFGLRVRNELNLDNITWECDYPHSDSTWPRSPESVVEALAGVDAETVAKITHLNAMRIFDYDPFAIVGKENCTVGALRALASDHDTSIQAKGKRTKHGTTMGEVIAVMSGSKS